VNEEETFRQSVRNLINVVFTEDMEYFDSLPEKVDRELGPPLSVLIGLVEDPTNATRLLSAAQIVEEVSAEIQDQVPADLAQLILAMSGARKEYMQSLS
jgi:hypothetical protein